MGKTKLCNHARISDATGQLLLRAQGKWMYEKGEKISLDELIGHLAREFLKDKDSVIEP